MTLGCPSRFTLLLSLCLFAFIASGCAADNEKVDSSDPEETASDTNPTTGADSESEDTNDDTVSPPSKGCQGIDILFVIDDSGSMTEEQTNLIANFPRFIEVLDEFEPEPGAHISYRVGVTTSGVNRKFKMKQFIPGFPTTTTSAVTTGPDGAFVNTEKCGLSEPWIDGPGLGVASEFSCVGQVGTMGSSTEMPLAAMELALGEKMAAGGPNEGFYRQDQESLLVVVFITDEDDCSVEEGGMLVSDGATTSDCNPDKSEGLYSIASVKGFLDDMAGGEGRYVAVAIAGPGPKSCSSSFGSAIYAQRMNQFIDLVGAYGVFGNICAGDLWTSLDEALSVIQVACRDLPPK